MTSTAETGLLARTVLQPKLGTLALIAVLASCLSLALGGLALEAVVEGGLVSWIIAPVGALGFFVFGWIAWWAISRRANAEPAIIIDEVGLFDNVSIAGAGRIRWLELDQIWLHEGPLGPLLCIRPRDLGDYLAEKEDLRAIPMRANLAFFGSPVVIPLWILDMPRDAICARVAEFAVPNQSPAPRLCR